jgi:hypothetical protein
MQISNKKFWLITILFLLLPFSVHWRLLLFGTKTTGTVIGHIKTYHHGNVEVYFAVIEFNTIDETYKVTGPEFADYPINKEICVFYRKRNPKKFLLFTFAGIYFSKKLIIPGVAFILWLAFFFSQRQSLARRKL